MQRSQWSLWHNRFPGAFSVQQSQGWIEVQVSWVLELPSWRIDCSSVVCATWVSWRGIWPWLVKILPKPTLKSRERCTVEEIQGNEWQANTQMSVTGWGQDVESRISVTVLSFGGEGVTVWLPCGPYIPFLYVLSPVFCPLYWLASRISLHIFQRWKTAA